MAEAEFAALQSRQQKEVLNRSPISSLLGAGTAFNRSRVAQIGISASISGLCAGFPGLFGVLRMQRPFAGCTTVSPGPLGRSVPQPAPRSFIPIMLASRLARYRDFSRLNVREQMPFGFRRWLPSQPSRSRIFSAFRCGPFPATTPTGSCPLDQAHPR